MRYVQTQRSNRGRNKRINKRVKPQKVGVKVELRFGNIGKVSGKGISQLSPLKYILLGNAHPLLTVKEFGSLSNSISVVTTPN